MYPAANFAPGVLPSGLDTSTILNPSQALNRYENYKVDTAIPIITDMSLYKIFSMTDRVKLRINVDAFNSFNIQGRVNPDTTDGVESLQTSYWTPRQIQFTARLSF